MDRLIRPDVIEYHTPREGTTKLTLTWNALTKAQFEEFEAMLGIVTDHDAGDETE